MAFITEYVPKLFKYEFEPESGEFHNQDELLNIPFVKKFRYDTDGKRDSYFHQYSITKNDELMVEVAGGKYYYVIGIIHGKHNLNLPKFNR